MRTAERLYHRSAIVDYGSLIALDTRKRLAHSAGLLEKTAVTAMPLTMAEQGMNSSSQGVGGYTPEPPLRMSPEGGRSTAEAPHSLLGRLPIRKRSSPPARMSAWVNQERERGLPFSSTLWT